MRQIFLLLFLLLLSACSVKPKTDINQVQTHQTLPQNWTLQGRIALKTPDDKFSASIQWHQEGEDYRLRLSKLIGGTLLVLENKNSSVALQFDGQTFQDYNAERLLWRATGWTLPVDDFKYWVAGLLNPTSPLPQDLQLDESSRIWSFTSSENWQVHYKNYKVFQGKALPHNLTIKKDGIELKLRVSDWQISD